MPKQTKEALDVLVEESAVKAPTPAPTTYENEVAQITAKENKRKVLAKMYAAEPKVPVMLSPFYAPYLGKTALVSVQGIAVYVPADGQVYKLNVTHAAQLLESIARIDARQLKLNRMANVTANYESSAGALKLV